MTAPSATTAPSTGPARSTVDPDRLAEQVGAAVLAHPSVHRLHGGPFGAIASYLPGRRLSGVRIGAGDEPVEVGVVLAVDRPIPAVVRELRAAVAALCDGAAVDVVVADVVLPVDVEPLPPPPTARVS